MFLGKVLKEVNDFVWKQNTIAYHPQTDGLLGMMLQQSSLIWSCDYSKPGQWLLTQKPMQEAN